MADTGTNAGVDDVSNHRRLGVIQPACDGVFVLESAGNLATTQAVLDRIERDSPPLARLREVWERLLLDAASQLPSVEDREIAGAAAADGAAGAPSPG